MPLHWFILFAVIVLGLQALIFKLRALSRLGYARTFSKHRLFAQDQVEMTETLRNDKLLPLPWVRLESMLPSSLHFGNQTNLEINSGELLQNHRSLFTLKSYTQIVRRHHITCTRRGVFRLNSATMTAGDLFGMFDAVRTIPLDLELIVYPEIVPLHEIPFSNKSWIGDMTVRRWILEDPFWKSGVRSYQPGDPLKNVHWKATARTNQLQVHQLDFTADRKIMILLNFETTKGMWSKVTHPEMIEQAISYAASIANTTIPQGIETGFACNGTMKSLVKGQPVILPPAAGTHHLTDLFENMAKLELELSASFRTFMEGWEEAAGTDFIILTAIPLTDMEPLLSRIRLRGNGIEIVEIRGISQSAREGEGDTSYA